MIGNHLSHYLIESELGRGGMGIVYRATDTKLNREVALKILPAAALASDDDRARFFREAQAAAQLHHPNIATVFEIDEAILRDGDGNEVNATDGADFNDSLITSTAFLAYQFESDNAALGYSASQDLAQSASHQRLTQEVGNNADQSASGVLTLYAPSSTTYVKHFTARFADSGYNDYVEDHYVAGYINDTTAIDEISFQFSSGNIDAGQIKMYGIAKA